MLKMPQWACPRKTSLSLALGPDAADYTASISGVDPSNCLWNSCHCPLQRQSGHPPPEWVVSRLVPLCHQFLILNLGQKPNWGLGPSCKGVGAMMTRHAYSGSERSLSQSRGRGCPLQGCFITTLSRNKRLENIFNIQLLRTIKYCLCDNDIRENQWNLECVSRQASDSHV